MMDKRAVRRIIGIALREDIGPGDVTTDSVVPGEVKGIARAVAKEQLVMAGIEVFRGVFQAVDSDLGFTGNFSDGEAVGAGRVIAEISGGLAGILRAERTALNLFQRMCGIATLTGRFVDEIKGTGAVILDTRKTAPGLRMLDKYSVRKGGGRNHRFALFDGILIKDNHIAAAGGITAAVKRARKNAPYGMKIEVEVKDTDEVSEALRAGVEIIMLDNMAPDEMRRAVQVIGGRALVEASGNVDLSNVRTVAETGVDFISVGALTHSVRASDISLRIERL